MNGIGEMDLKVALIDSDYYTEQAIHAYLAWDRRTRALTDYSSLAHFWQSLDGVDSSAYPDVVILDVNNTGDRADIRLSIQRLVDTISSGAVVCLSHVDDLDLFYAAAAGGARAFLHKEDARIYIASAVCLASQLRPDELLYSRRMDGARRILNHRRASSPLAIALPGPVQYAGLQASDSKGSGFKRRRAIELYAIEGMPAALIADELRLSESTVRDYIKSAYDALGLHDYDDTFLANLSQRERAFMKLTALEAPRR